MRLLWSRAAQAYGASQCRACLVAGALAVTRPCPVAPFLGQRRSKRTCQRAGGATTRAPTRVFFNPQPFTDSELADLQETFKSDIRLRHLFGSFRPSLACLAGLSVRRKTAPGRRYEDNSEGPWRVRLTRDGVAKVLWTLVAPQFQLRHHYGKVLPQYRRWLTGLYDSYQLPLRTQTFKKTDKLDHAELEAAVVAEEAERPGVYPHPCNRQQADQSTKSFVWLTRRLMHETYQRTYRNDKLALSRAKNALDGGWHNLKMLRADGYPKYKHDADPESHDAIQDSRLSNEALRVIFNTWHDAKVAEDAILCNGRLPDGTLPKSPLAPLMMARICAKLHLQSARPDILTFNTLITGLLKVGKLKLAGLVVDHLLRKTRLRVTAQSLVCILRTYQARGDVLGFYHMIRRMIGKHITGVTLRRVATPYYRSKRARSYRRFLRTTDKASYQGYVLERAPLTQSVIEALLGGLVAFRQNQHASQVLALALRLGCAVKIETLVNLLNLIAATVDHGGASVLVRGLCANVDDVVTVLLDDNCPRDIPARLREVLDLYACRLLHKTWDTRRDIIYNDHYLARNRRLAAVLTEDYPSRASLEEAERELPGLGRLLTALWTTEAFGEMDATVDVEQSLYALQGSRSTRKMTELVDSLEALETRVQRIERQQRWRAMATYHIIHERFSDIQLRVKRCDLEFLLHVKKLYPLDEEPFASVFSESRPPQAQLDSYWQLVASRGGVLIPDFKETATRHIAEKRSKARKAAGLARKQLRDERRLTRRLLRQKRLRRSGQAGSLKEVRREGVLGHRKKALGRGFVARAPGETLSWRLKTTFKNFVGGIL